MLRSDERRGDGPRQRADGAVREGVDYWPPWWWSLSRSMGGCPTPMDRSGRAADDETKAAAQHRVLATAPSATSLESANVDHRIRCDGAPGARTYGNRIRTIPGKGPDVPAIRTSQDDAHSRLGAEHRRGLRSDYRLRREKGICGREKAQCCPEKGGDFSPDSHGAGTDVLGWRIFH